MISKPCEYSVVSNDFVNSFLLSFSSENLNQYLSSKSNELETDFLTCSRCGIAPNENVTKIKNAFLCKCGKKEFKLENSKMIKNQSCDSYYTLENTEETTSRKQILLLLCIDYSGSMSKHYEIPNDPLIKAYIQERNSLLSAIHQQDLSGNIFITRKEIILCHLKQEIHELTSKNSNIDYKVFVIAFSKEITLYGDGTENESITLPAEEFEKIKNDWAKCRAFGKNNCLSVFSSKKKLNLNSLFDKLEVQDATGCTSLAPAIAAGLGAVEKIDPDACQFLIFTDGLANNGFGDIEICEGSKDKQSKCMLEYENLGKFGLQIGVVFHLFAFSDEKAGLKITQRLIDLTYYGDLYRVEIEKKKTYNIKKLKEDIKQALSLSNELYAKRANMKIFSDSRLKVRFAEKAKENSREEEKCIWKNIGGIYNKNTWIGVIYEIPKNIFEKNETLFFQIQFNFIRVSDKKNCTIVINFKSPLKVLEKGTIDFFKLKAIMFNDDIESNQEKMKSYQKFVEKFGENDDNMNDFKNLDIKDKKEPKTGKNKEEELKKENEDEKDEDDEDGVTICIRNEKKKRKEEFETELVNKKNIKKINL